MPGRIHRHVAERARRASAGDGLRTARRHRPHLRARRVDARHIAGFLVVLVVVGEHVEVFFLVILVDAASRGCAPRTSRYSRSSMRTRLRSGSKPNPMSRARNNGTVGSRNSVS